MTYDDPPVLPGWMVFDTLSFGAVPRAFANLRVSDKRLNSGISELPRDRLASWRYAAAYLRNLCASQLGLKSRIPRNVFRLAPTGTCNFDSLSILQSCRLNPDTTVAVIEQSRIGRRSARPFRGASLNSSCPNGIRTDWAWQEIWHQRTTRTGTRTALAIAIQTSMRPIKGKLGL